MPAYALTIFIGAFLLFQVQPLIGKYILPWFGGGPGVWTTCMLFFQMLLLCGYAYAHFISRWLKPRTQAIVHLALVVAALMLLPITPGDSWKPHLPNPHPAHREPGASLFRSLVNGAADATMVQPDAPGRIAVPALRAFEFRVAARAGHVSVLFRDAFHPQNAGGFVGVGVGGIRALQRILCDEGVAG